ncbi:MAG TPA: hypothetical protein H9782_11370 [Candidatus Bariatricus faecipullorum]|nr:hypothetical protein [Candidatus Bariatricus faecipullorum]
MKRMAEVIILSGTVLAVAGTMAIRHDWDEARKAEKAEQTKAETVHIPSQEKEGTLVMVYPDGTSVELTGTIEVMPRDGKWYVEFREE